MTKPAVNYHGLLGLLQNFEKDHQLYKESVNVVGGSSSGCRLFNKGKKKNKKKKNKKVQLHAGMSAQDQTKKRKPDRKSTRLNSSHSGESRMPSSA